MLLLSPVQEDSGWRARAAPLWVRAMRIVVTVLLLLVFVPMWAGEPRAPRFAANALLTIAPLDLPPGLRNGRLTYLAGWELDSNDPAFGGFSALSVMGRRFTLLSDGGTLVAFTLSPGGRLSGVQFGALPDGPGSGWRKEHRDSESLALDPATGRAWVGFEPSDDLRGSVWRYAPGFVRAERRARPASMRRWPINGGAESLVRLRSGGFVALAESARIGRSRRYRAVMFAGDPAVPDQRWFGFSYRPPLPRFKPTDAAQLPGGDLVVVNRSASLERWFLGNIAIIEAGDIRPGATADGTLAGHIAPPLPQDNYEGIAVTREGQDTILWVVSDDNESILQRTILLKFRLEAAPLATAGARPAN